MHLININDRVAQCAKVQLTAAAPLTMTVGLSMIQLHNYMIQWLVYDTVISYTVGLSMIQCCSARVCAKRHRLMNLTRATSRNLVRKTCLQAHRKAA